MSPRLRTAGGVAALLAFAALAVLAIPIVRDLRVIAMNLADPQPLIESIVDEYLAATLRDPGLRRDDPLLAARKIVVTSNINEFAAKDVTARLLYLNALDPRQPIDLYVSTQGGWVDSAFTIIDVMEMIEAPVNTWAIGGCYSAGSLIVAAGTGRRAASPSAILMIHASLDEDPKRPYSYERLAIHRYEDIWRQHAQLPAEWFPMVGGEEYYLSPQEALEFKMIDAIDAR